MKRRDVIKLGFAGAAGLYINPIFAKLNYLTKVDQPILFKPNWESLSKYKVPDWFRDAKFGMWAHWGPQCEPEAGDWYARGMYQEGSWQYKFHVKKYGHPSKFGFKDVINVWKADKWNPEELVNLYKDSGAKYFMAMANHHDNLDLYDSKYQPNWNTTKLGPKKDIIAGWEKAARKAGLPFAVSVHAAHAWSWFETSQRADKKGDLAGIPYDGNLTKEDGAGTWWEGLDPQELYAQNHPLSENSLNNGTIHSQWNWGNGVVKPSDAYIEKFYNRTIDLIDKYNPDLVYFDDTALPLWPISDAGLRIAAHLYNKSLGKNETVQTVVTGKILDEQQRKAMVWDIEKGQSNNIEPLPWQTDTCIGNWHYDRGVYNDKRYKSAKTVIHTLVDVVSKNGNLMLNIPVRGDGSIDELERKIVEEIGVWMKLNNKSIYGTRPWKIFGEGPQQESAAALTAQGFNEGKGKPYTFKDIRFAQKEDILYATVMAWPEDGKILIKSLGKESKYHPQKIKKIKLLSTGEKLKYKQHSDFLEVYFPNDQPKASYANVLEIMS
ncbi:alpha-L-fucosidase [Wenyingzhuangia marina]|uniref:alpha-L-fucosidase n=1 Tax=Wenyingzhuangia marina TaxID=1195760 RepID=A0A1M5W2J2_9FLAO|nr:alpha-L-fucosidase [Wenyingzhuangia marina]GGF76410.1 alpha-L-fucosidase [Wenyingzhuangia marina]SHH81650.1 alpha-L-fucosidase [Wenyingzhuangia marina]